jgi:hypothetical protein
MLPVERPNQCEGIAMANLDTHSLPEDLSALRSQLRRSAHVQHAKRMMLAAGLSAFGMVAIAAAFLTRIV